eukprot:11220091-Lingulodinium_polyedra.AAC.1
MASPLQMKEAIHRAAFKAQAAIAIGERPKNIRFTLGISAGRQAAAPAKPIEGSGAQPEDQGAVPRAARKQKQTS